MKALGKVFIASLFIVTAFSAVITSFRSSSSAASATQFTQQPQAGTTSPEGAELYKQKCAACHDEPQERVPPLFLIRRRSAEDVIQTLTGGAMKQQAAGLSVDQIRE